MKRLNIDFRSDIPIYQQIVDQIQYMISTNELKPGDQLPTVRAVAQELRINFNTVSRSYRILDQAGLISTQQGRGTYISDRIPEKENGSIKTEMMLDLIQDFLNKGQQLGYSKEQILELLGKISS
ncbi:MAG TPA: GntR family transcriptional regulator [Anaerolineales bacterium]|nr:GntR family transcriptional regulator [Anaerolineales bacterium]